MTRDESYLTCSSYIESYNTICMIIDARTGEVVKFIDINNSGTCNIFMNTLDQVFISTFDYVGSGIIN